MFRNGLPDDGASWAKNAPINVAQIQWPIPAMTVRGTVWAMSESTIRTIGMHG
jgi:hypothetical protein